MAWEAHQEPVLARSTIAGSGVLGDRVVLVVWNVHKKTDSVFQRELRGLLDATEADVALFQEFVLPRPERLDVLLQRRAWALSANLRAGAPPAETGVFTAAASLSRAEAFLSSDREPLFGTRKACLATFHAFGADTLLALNLHALNFSFSLDGYRRQLQAVAVFAASHRGPVVVGGDFNTWNARRLRLADSVLAGASLVRLDFGAHERNKRKSFGKALDHVYYDPRFLRPDAKSIDVPHRYRSSDHVPLVVGFERVRQAPPQRAGEPGE